MTDQTAAADVAAELSRRLMPAAAQAMPLPQVGNAGRAAVATDAARRARNRRSQAPTRQSPAASTGAVAAIESPSIASVARLRCAADVDSCRSAGIERRRLRDAADEPSAARQRRRSGDRPGDRSPSTRRPLPRRSPREPPAARPPEASLATTTRGDQGSPQSSMATEVALPSPPGQGSGTTIGSPSVGPMRRSDAAGDGTAGVASATNVVGRPGRGRAVGPSLAANNQLTGGALAAVAGPAVQPGNATMRRRPPAPLRPFRAPARRSANEPSCRAASGSVRRRSAAPTAPARLLRPARECSAGGGATPGIARRQRTGRRGRRRCGAGAGSGSGTSRHGRQRRRPASGFGSGLAARTRRACRRGAGQRRPTVPSADVAQDGSIRSAARSSRQPEGLDERPHRRRPDDRREDRDHHVLCR